MSMPGSSLIIQTLRALNFSRLLNLLLNSASYLISNLVKRPVSWGLPWSLSLEPTTSCNLQCPECPSGLRQFTRPTGKMDTEFYKSLVDMVSPHLVYLNLYFQGEPFLNKNIFEMVSYARRNKLLVSTSTNGHFLDDDNARKIVESGLNRLIISIDGLDQETYATYRRGGDLGKVTEGVNNLIKWKKQLKSALPFIEIQFLVLGTNEHQLDAFKKAWTKTGVNKLTFKSAQLYQPENNPFLTSIHKHSRYIRKAENKISIKSTLPDQCYRMWHSAVVTWDGRLVPCCFDKNADFEMGDLSRKTLREVWNSIDYQSFRKHILRNRSSIEMCCNCTEGLR